MIEVGWKRLRKGLCRCGRAHFFFAEELFSWVVVEPLTIALFVGLLCVELGRARQSVFS